MKNGYDQKDQGNVHMKELITEAIPENVITVTEFVNDLLDKAGCTDRARIQINIAIDEIFSNIVKYAYDGKGGSIRVRVDDDPDRPDHVHITFIDSGTPFDPMKAKDPDTSLSASERKRGGLGLYIVKKTMDEVSYKYSEGFNMLSFTKNIKISGRRAQKNKQNKLERA